MIVTGECRDVPRVLAAMDVFALPSVAEGISNTVLEAMASGLPVIASAVGGNPELVEEGVTGQLVPRGDVMALGAAIDDYLGDPHLRALHGKAGRERAAQQFGLDRMCAAYDGLYRGLLGGRPKGGA
jgi:glycosyltransferase involved in cell wall biosynthesis